MPTTQSLIKSNIDALKEGVELLSLLEKEQYIAGFKPAFHSTIGAHFRHLLEHYRCLFDQLPNGVLCYDKRERDSLLECDIEYAKRTLKQMQSELSSLSSEVFSREYLIEDQQAVGQVTTSLQRELLFLQSHTVHHYAIIGAMTRAFGKQPEDDFGIAIATRNHQAESCNETPLSETPPCAQ